MDYEMESAISSIRSEISDVSYAVEQAKREAWSDLDSAIRDIQDSLNNLSERVSILEAK